MIDRDTQKPFIEFEYEAAKTQSIPCLIYFKQSQLSAKKTFQETTNSNYEIFKNRVRENDVVNFFANIKEFEQEFVIEFIKLLQGVLFDKVDLKQENPFSLDTLHLLCRASIKEQIRAVGRDKYIADVYIERDAEKEIDIFVNFENTFLEQTDKIIDDLNQISHNYRLRDEAYSYLQQAKKILRKSQTLEGHSQLINKLKKGFYYDEVETIVSLVNRTVRLPRERNQKQIYDNFIIIDLLLQKLPFVNKRSLPELSEKLIRLGFVKELGAEISEEIVKTLEILPSKSYGQEKNTRKLANDLIKDIDKLVQLQVQKCIALVSNAGYGKTNLLCHLANSLSENHPVILLSGQMEITSQYDIEYYIQRQLESFVPGNFANWMNRIKQILDNSNRQHLFILIDGINENSNSLLRNFIDHIEDKRIKLIVSCRNIFWDLFSARLKPSLFQNRKIELDEFKKQEIDRAIRLYFQLFNIQSNFDASNLLALRNPLLLRFFCEAYQGRYPDKEVSNLELLRVFELYIERVEANIIEQLGLLRNEQIVGLLTKLGHRMWLKRKTSLKFCELEITPEEKNKSNSIYNLIRSENLIFEESLQVYKNQKTYTVRFLYDEFMEYIIARSWLEQLAVSQELETEIEILLQEAVSTLSSFSPAFGAILFLDKMLERNGELVNRIISLLATSEDEFVASRQIIMLKAFERIDINNVGGELIIALDKFERIARDEIKEKLAPIIIKVLRQHPNHPLTREMISRMLEVGNAQTIASEDEKKELQSILEKGSSMRRSSRGDEAELLCLPPGRYHYKEEMKLNAISILVASKNSQDFTLIEEGINSLGKMELHSALTALTSLDLADDELLYKMLAKYYNAYLSEYRIYCAWLLRNRYGKQPSEYLTGLLMDKATRVHRYTLSIFEKRRIEKELIISLLAVIQQVATIKSWHLMNIIKILGKRHQFYSQDIVLYYGQLIISTLTNICSHSQASVRLEAYKSLMQYDEFIKRKFIISAMEKDKDIYIRRLAENIKVKN